MNIINAMTITYTGRDAAGRPYRGTITVDPENLPPVAGPDTAAVTAGETIVINALINDFDAEGELLTITGATAESGSVTVEADGTLSYTAPNGPIGADTVVYTLSDEAGNTAVGTVTITILDADHPPVAGADVATVTAGGTISIDVLANDTDAEGGSLTVTGATAESGSVTVEADGTLSYTAPAAAGTDTITYQVRDSAGNTSSATVTVTVEALNLPPETLDDVASAAQGETIVIEALANVTDPEGGPLTITEAGATHGSVTVNADGTLSYTAPADFTGSDTIGYTVSDEAGNTAEGRITVGVDAPPNEPPVAVDDTAAVATPGGTISIDVLANDTDPEGGRLTVTEATAESGSVTVEADGTLTYTAPSDFSGTDTIAYTIADSAGATDQGQVTVTVTPLQLVIDAETPVGDFAVEAGSGDLKVTIIEPADYAGTHVIQTADLQQGPINLTPSRIQGGTTYGSTLSTVPGIWAGDETHGPIAFTQQWYRGSEAIGGATGDSYAIQSGDTASGLHYSRQATNSAGSRSITVEALAATPGGAFAERGVRFTAPAKLIRNADLAPADSQNVLWFVSLIPHATGRHGILRQTSIYNGVEIWEGLFQFRASMPGANRAVSSRPLTAGQRANFLATASGSGGGTTALRLFSRFAGESGWTEEKSDEGGSGPVDLTFGGFSVGGRHGGDGHNLNATIYRIAFWSDLEVDLGDAAVFARFLKSDGTLEDPEVSRGLYGPPRVDLFGPAEDYAEGVNHGTAGNFDSMEGTFTNA